MAKAAVLTGDLVGSTRARPEATDDAIEHIAAVAAQLKGYATFTRFRGDGWQLYLDRPGLALAVSILIISGLRASGKLETRISIGLGGASLSSRKTLLATRDLLAATGTAFITSGRALDQMPRDRRLVLSGEGVDRLHQRLVALLDERISTWSPEQAEVAAMALRPNDTPTQSAMAEHLGISRQAVAARLKASGFASITAAANDFLLHFSEGQQPHA